LHFSSESTLEKVYLILWTAYIAELAGLRRRAGAPRRTGKEALLLLRTRVETLLAKLESR